MRGERAVIAGSGLSEAEWEALVREAEQSGLKRKGFCEARGIAVSWFDSCRYRCRRLKQRPAAPATRLAPVELASSVGRRRYAGGVDVGERYVNRILC